MFYFWLVLIGIVGGVLGGMGMGGGTLLIPLLTIGLGILQHNAQAINLLAFLPMSIFAIIIHSKNKLIKFKVAIPVIITGVLSSLGGAYLATIIKNEKLSFWFGIFLIGIGIFQVVSLIFFKSKNLSQKNNDKKNSFL